MHSHSWYWQLKDGITIEFKDLYRIGVAIVFFLPIRIYLDHLISDPQIDSSPINFQLETWLNFQDKLITVGCIFLLLGWFTRIVALLIGLFTVLHMLLIEIFQFSDLNNHLGINILLFSALILLAILGSGKLSIDHYWHKMSNS